MAEQPDEKQRDLSVLSERLQHSRIERRDFIKKALATGALVYISPAVATILAQPAYASVTSAATVTPSPAPTATSVPPITLEKPMYVQYVMSGVASAPSNSVQTNQITVPAGKMAVIEFIHMNTGGGVDTEFDASFGITGGPRYLGRFDKQPDGPNRVYSNGNVLFVIGPGEWFYGLVQKFGSPSTGMNVQAIMSGQLLSV